MKKPFLLIVCILIGLVLIEVPHSFYWKYALPEKEGFSTPKLSAMRDTLIKHGTTTLLVIRNDKIILEWYKDGWHRNRRHFTASLAKAVVGGMALLLALNDGRLKADDPVWKYIPEWKDDLLKSKITIRHLATHSSGISEAVGTKQELTALQDSGVVMKDSLKDMPGWKGDFWRQDINPFIISRDIAPVIFEPGTAYQYSNPAIAMLGYVITVSYKGTVYKDIRTLLKERIFKPLGIRDDEWSIGYRKTFQTNGLNLVPNWGGAQFTPRAIARIGRLMLNKGNWNGKQIIDSFWVDQVLKYEGTPLPPRLGKNPELASTLGWFLNFDGIWDDVPRDMFMGSGAHNQHLIVIPSMNMIVVRNGIKMYDESKGEGTYYGSEKYLGKMLMDSYESGFLSNK